MTVEIDYGFTLTECNHFVARNILSQAILSHFFFSFQHVVNIAGVQIGIFAIGSGRDCILIISAIIRGLRSTLSFRVIRQRGHLRSAVASLAALDLVTILVFGIPVGSVVYISRLT